MELPREGSPEASPKAASRFERDESCVPSSSDEESKCRATTRTGRCAARKNAGRNKYKSFRDRKQSSPFILQWLQHNYEMVPGACLPRSVLYTHYQDFCKRNQIDPSSAASFGKIIRLKFPNLSTRRLGTRGQSKYHYYGLAIKESSVYYRSVYSKKGLTRFSGASAKRDIHNSQSYNPSCKTGILLPSFPKISDINISEPFPVNKVETFLMMYRAHCQRILDSVVRANFNEVQGLLLHFWRGMPTHLLSILDCQTTVNVIVVCDFTLYKCLYEVLIPSTLQPLTEGLMVEVIMFSHRLVQWLSESLKDLPSLLGMRKVQVAEMFGKSLRRQAALVQLAKGARGVLRNSDAITNILHCWQSTEFSSVLHATDKVQDSSAQSNSKPEINASLPSEFAHEFEQLFVKQSSLETYFEWLDSVIEKRICEPSELGCNMVELIQDFLVAWNAFYTQVEKAYHAVKDANFDSFCTLHLALDAYVSYVMELLQVTSSEQQYMNALRAKTGADYVGQHSGSYLSTQDMSLGQNIKTEMLNNRDNKFLESPITTVVQDNPVYAAVMPNYIAFHQDMCNVNMYSFVKSESSTNFSPCMEQRAAYNPECNESFCLAEHGPHTPQSSHYSTNSPPSQSSLASPESCVDFEFSLSSTSSAESPKRTDACMVIPSTHLCSAVPTMPGMATSVHLLNEDYTNRYELFHDMFCGLPYMEYTAPPMACGYGPFEPHEQHDLVTFAPNPDDFLVNPFCVPHYTKQVHQQTHSTHIH